MHGHTKTLHRPTVGYELTNTGQHDSVEASFPQAMRPEFPRRKMSTGTIKTKRCTCFVVVVVVVVVFQNLSCMQAAPFFFFFPFFFSSVLPSLVISFFICFSKFKEHINYYNNNFKLFYIVFGYQRASLMVNQIFVLIYANTHVYN